MGYTDMPGSFPDLVSGGLVIRDGSICTPQPNVLNAYCPPASFTTSCDITALPSDCTARITPAQINAIVSELVCFASTINPDGTWNCASLCNLATNFNAWWVENEPHGDGTTITVDGGPASSPLRFSIIPVGAVNAICADDTAREILADCLVSEICTNLVIREALATCVISADVGNRITIGSDGGLLVPLGPVGVAACSDYVQVTDVNGANLRLIPHRPEPIELRQRDGINPPGHDVDATNYPGVGAGNGYSTAIYSVVVNNPDTCRPMKMTGELRANTRYQSAEGPAFSLIGEMYFDQGDGILVLIGTQADATVIPENADPALVLQQRKNFTRSFPTGSDIVVPPGGSVTLRWQYKWYLPTTVNRNNSQLHPVPVFADINGGIVTNGRSL